MAEETIINEEKKEEKPCNEVKKELKKSKSNKQIEELKAEAEKQKELFLRTAAEFDNYKRRTEKERIEIYERATAAILKKLLTIFDNADRAADADKSNEDYQKGIELIAKQLVTLSEQLGVEPIGKVGDIFDPNIHEAIMHIEDENLPENSIASVMQKGYKYGNTILRPAMVSVAN